ncbi:MAG: hypothetical protein GTN36_05555, partial [Candidatus Aenigmarchaeota archaeon]|nr:hypothetical protein [Candidatus Aenigmarchaeota archaeon]
CYSYNYAKDVIKDRFEKGEEAISKNAQYSYYYAEDVIKDRWEKGEEAILKSIWKNDYKEFLKGLK